MKNINKRLGINSISKPIISNSNKKRHLTFGLRGKKSGTKPERLPRYKLFEMPSPGPYIVPKIQYYHQKEDKINIILVSLNNFQNYVLINLQQLLDLGHLNIFLITDLCFFENIPENIKSKINLISKESLNEEYNFYEKSKLDKNAKNGFWTLTSSRFFYIYALMKNLNLQNVFHMENDVLIYYNCNLLLPLENKIYIPFDCYKRSIASIVYIPNQNVLKTILDNYSYDKNDMENFAIIREKVDIINNFPIFNSLEDKGEIGFVSKNFDKFNFIFDAAAIGQYIGGVDNPNDTVGFVNETCVIKYNSQVIKWDSQKKPYLGDIPIFNLHIHCKNLLKFKNNLFDIVIPVGPNDIEQLERQIKFTKQNVLGYRNIYLISFKADLNIEGCITIDENIFPFSIKDVARYHGSLKRNGWYLQQLLKLYAGLVIPNILERYLIIDSDVYFLNPTVFIEIENSVLKSLFNPGTEHTYEYFDHMKKLDSSFEKVQNISGISHHMLIETKYIKEMFKMVEEKHSEIFWKVFLNKVEPINYIRSGASEYELYFNYMLKYHSDQIKIRNLRWENINNDPLSNINNLIQNYDYVAWHWFKR